MKIIEHIQHTYGRRVVLDTPLRLATYDTVSALPASGTGRECKFTLAFAVRTRLVEDDVEVFHEARKEAARYITRELYGDVIDRLVEISLKDYETNRSGTAEVRQMIDSLIGELR